MEVNLVKNVKILNNARPSEILVAHFLGHFIFKEMDLIVGDSPCIPDIYNSNRTLGVEVVQIELESDLDKKKIARFAESGVEFKEVVSLVNEKYRNHKYRVCNVNGKACGIISEDFLFRTRKLFNIIDKSLKSKNQKLEKGNYSNITGEIDLCLVNMYRNFGDREIEYILTKCNDLKMSFKRIFVLLRSKLVVIENGRIRETISIENSVMNELILQAKNNLKV